MGQNTRDIRVWTALVTLYVVWGSTYLGIMIAIETLPPLFSGGFRFLIAAPLLALGLLWRRGRSALRMSRREFLGAALVGVLLLTGGNGMIAVAQQHISTGLAALLVASVPLWLVLFRVAVRDRPQTLTLAGVLMGFGGVAALSLTGGSGGSSTVGVLIVLAASFSWSIGSFISGRIPMPKDPFAASTVEMLAGGTALIVLATAFGERLDLAHVSGRSLAGLAYLILVGSLIGFTSYVWLLGNAPISLVSTYAYVNPVVAVILGMLVLGETATTGMIVGGLVIVAGVALVVSTERRGRATAAPLPKEPEGEARPQPARP
ncbi:EamA family transporter [Thermopolyspora sp. NPDC052614]|uniref:EamA family transporter n=1 Tax=Thermopolyspora sp. NPDC052614 TaxID=3155682 RepID=UPI0034199BD0